MKVAIYGSRRQKPYAGDIQKLLRNLILSGVDVCMHPKLYNHLTEELDLSLSGVSVAPADYAEMNDVDIVLSIGGDGTFLRTAAWVGERQTPILGINTGHLGYLAPLPISAAPDYVDKLLERDFTVERRALAAVKADKIFGWAYALNEVVVAKDDSASMISAKTWLGDKLLADYKADGLIVATPTGSTAYNMSAGGPIVQPTAPVWVITPIAAHSLSMRPLVIDNTMAIKIQVDGRGHTFRLSLDGRSTTLPMGSEINVSRAPFETLIIQPHGCAFPAVLRDKLMFC